MPTFRGQDKIKTGLDRLREWFKGNLMEGLMGPMPSVSDAAYDRLMNVRKLYIFTYFLGAQHYLQADK